MKKALTALALCAAGLAHADVISLDKTPCYGLTRNCPDISNAAGVDVDYYAATSYSTATMYLDGVAYTGPNTPSYAAMTNAIGQTIIVQVQFSTYRTCTSSGRGQHCSMHWTVESGTITR
ncbi:MAG: hypothetical protein ACXWJ1_05085 [Caldimonas sp.]